MDILTGVLLHMDTGKTDRAPDVAQIELKAAPFADRLIELRDLIPFGEIWIEVVFARKAVKAADL